MTQPSTRILVLEVGRGSLSKSIRAHLCSRNLSGKQYVREDKRGFTLCFEYLSRVILVLLHV